MLFSLCTPKPFFPSRLMCSTLPPNCISPSSFYVSSFKKISFQLKESFLSSSPLYNFFHRIFFSNFQTLFPLFLLLVPFFSSFPSFCHLLDIGTAVTNLVTAVPIKLPSLPDSILFDTAHLNSHHSHHSQFYHF